MTLFTHSITALMIQLWWKWKPKKYLRSKWISKYGTEKLMTLTKHRVAIGSQFIYLFLQDSLKRAMHLKTRGGKSIDLRLSMHRFYHHVKLIQKIAKRFTVIRAARIVLLEKKWEQVEIDIAISKRDLHVENLLKEREQIRMNALLKDAEYREDNEEYEDNNNDGTNNEESEEKYQTRRPKRNFKGKDEDEKQDGSSSSGLTSHLSSSLSWSKGVKPTQRSTSMLNKDGMSPFIMKQLMEEQLNNALGKGGNRRKSTGNNKGEASLNQHIDFSSKTTEDLAKLMTKYLNEGNRTMVSLILDALDHTHDDLDTPSGGVSIAQFLVRVKGDVRKDSINDWMRRQMRKVRNAMKEEHDEDVRLWKVREMKIDITQTKQMLLNMAKEDGNDDDDEDEDEETNQWSRMQKLLKRGVIDVGLETSKETKPVYPTVLLLTGPFFNEYEFRKQVIKTLDHMNMG